jgi:WD40 repeat protein
LSQKKDIKTQLLLILIVIAYLIPGYGSAFDSTNVSSPMWSDKLGQYEVLVACSDNCSFIIAGSDTGILRMYDGAGRTIWTYLTNGTAITSVSISGDGGIISATSGGEILVFKPDGTLFWNYSTGAVINRIAVSKNGETIVTSGDNVLYLFDSKGNFLGKEIQKGVIWNVAISEDGRYSAAAVDLGWRERKGALAIIDRNSLKFLDYSTMSQGVGVGVSSEGNSIVGIDDYNLYSIFQNGTTRWNFTSSPQFKDIAITSDGKYIVAGSQYYLRVFNQTGSLLWQNQEAGYLNSVAISENGDYIIAGSSDHVRLFDKSGKILWYYNHRAFHVAASKNGDYFVVGTQSEIQFFTRMGNKMIVESISTPTSSTNHSVNTLAPADSSPSTTQPAPLPDTLVIFAIGCVCAKVIAKKKRNEP